MRKICSKCEIHHYSYSSINWDNYLKILVKLSKTFAEFTQCYMCFCHYTKWDKVFCWFNTFINIASSARNEHVYLKSFRRNLSMFKTLDRISRKMGCNWQTNINKRSTNYKLPFLDWTSSISRTSIIRTLKVTPRD